MRRVHRVLGILPTAMVLVAEGAWVFVVYALFQAASRAPVAIDPLGFAGAATLGAIAARVLQRRLGGEWPVVVVALVGLAGIVGWLTDAAPRELVLAGRVDAAVLTHPGGWLVGLAFLRGIGVRRAAVSDTAADDATTDAGAGPILVLAIPAIVGSFMLGGALPAAASAAFRSAALPATVLFVEADLVGLALARIARLDTTGGFDWRRNPAWVAALVVVAAVLALVAVPASFLVGPLIVVVLAALPVPLLVLGLVSGFDWRAVRILLTTLAAVVVAVVILRLFAGGSARQQGAPQAAAVPPTPATDQAWMTVIGWVLVVTAIAILVAVLAAIWMRRGGVEEDGDVAEERTIERGTAAPLVLTLPWARRRARVAQPHDAVSAYLATISAIDPYPVVRRAIRETPAEHARRLAAGTVTSAIPPALATDVARLAADYELARFGGRAISGREDARAVARYGRVRRLATTLTVER